MCIRDRAWEAAKAFLDYHRNDKGILSAEDDAAYTRMEQEIIVSLLLQPVNMC